MLQNLEKNTKKLLEAGLNRVNRQLSMYKNFFDQANTGLKSSANKKASQGYFFYLSLARLGPFKTILFLSCTCGLLLFGFLVVEIKWDSLNNLANKNMEK